VRRTIDMNVHRRTWKVPHQLARGAGMVKVHVGEDDVAQVARAQPQAGQPGAENVEARGGARIDDSGFGTQEHIGGDGSLEIEVPQVEASRVHESLSNAKGAPQ
jgi:hypothetical protein